VWGVSFSEDGHSLVSCSDDRSVVLWHDAKGDLSFQKAASVEEVHARAIYTIDWQKSAGGVIVTGGADDAICVLEAKVGGAEPSLTLVSKVAKAHAGDVNLVAWGAAERGDGLLASAGDDGAIRLWRRVGGA